MARSIDVPTAHNQVFNVGADTPYTLNDLARAMADAMGIKPEIVHVASRNEVKHAYSSHDKCRRIFGGSPPTPLQKGLSRMAQWAKSVGPRQSRRFGEIEIPRNLPPSWLT